MEHIANPRAVYNSGGYRYGDIATRVRAPEYDSDVFSGTGDGIGGETMRYDGYYQNNPQSMNNNMAQPSSSQFTALNPAGYHPTNTISNGLWNDQSTNNNSREPDKTEAFSEFEDLGERSDRTRPSSGFSGRDGNSRPRGRDQITGDAGVTWQQTVDPYGGGRSELLRELKDKFILLTTPLTKFVTRYLALSESNRGEAGIHDLIKVRRLFDQAQETHDWEGLVETLYGGNTSDLIDSGQLDPRELADALIDMVKKEEELSRHILNEDGSYDEAERTRREVYKMFNDHGTIKSRTRAMLRKNYNAMVSGKVVFLLDPILRETAQATLDLINEKHRERWNRSNFELLDIMKSNAVMTAFIKLMLVNKQGANMLSVNPMNRPASGGGMYGTLADRASAGSASYQRQAYGKGDSFTTIMSRPTVANMVATSLEYQSGMRYFANVDYAKDGSGGLIYVPRRGTGADRNYNNSRHNGRRGGVVETDRDSNKVGFNKSTSTYGTGADPNNTDLYVPTLPIETIQSVMMRQLNMSSDMYSEAYLDNVDPKVMSYRDKAGVMRLVNRHILTDTVAMTNYYNTGSVGRYAVRADLNAPVTRLHSVI